MSAASLISRADDGGAACLVLSARGVKTASLMLGERASLAGAAGGEFASDPTEHTELTDWWRPRATGRLERNP